MTRSVQHGMVVDGHLGGYVPGGDVGTWYPKLWDWLISVRGVDALIDVGCGEGHTLDYFRERGCQVLGVDGLSQERPDVIEHDYTLDGLPIGDFQNAGVTLCWSAEFVEHVDERYVSNFLTSFACADLVLMTHAVPGQNGWHHVNCRTDDYWIGALAAIGFTLDEQLTTDTRELAAMNGRETNYYRDTGLAFVRA